MLNIQTKTISIVIGQDQPHLSKEQKAFNTLIKKIDAKRVRLAAWQEIIPSYQRKYASELAPLVKTSQDIEIELVHCLDRTSDRKGLTSTERRMIDDLISELAGRLAAERDDADLKSIYNKHSGSDFDAEETAAVEGMKSMFEDVLGVDLGDDFDMSSPEELSPSTIMRNLAADIVGVQHHPRIKRRFTRISRHQEGQSLAQRHAAAAKNGLF